MNNEYIIVNKTAIEKRIEELESKRDSDECSDPRDYSYLCGKIHELRQVLQLSTPLIPEIEKAFNNGFHKGYNVGQADAQSHPLALTIANHIHKDKQDYISNLKLDI